MLGITNARAGHASVVRRPLGRRLAVCIHWRADAAFASRSGGALETIREGRASAAAHRFTARW